MSEEKMSLDKLPPEVLVKIFHFLKPSDLHFKVAFVSVTHLVYDQNNFANLESLLSFRSSIVGIVLKKSFKF